MKAIAVWPRQGKCRTNASAHGLAHARMHTHVQASNRSPLPDARGAQQEGEEEAKHVTCTPACAPLVARGTHQSMVQQLTSEGNWRSRSLKASPMGLMASTMCRLSRVLSTKYDLGVGGGWQAGRRWGR